MCPPSWTALLSVLLSNTFLKTKWITQDFNVTSSLRKKRTVHTRPLPTLTLRILRPPLCHATPQLRRSKQVQRNLRVWPEGITSALQDCYGSTEGVQKGSHLRPAHLFRGVHRLRKVHWRYHYCKKPSPYMPTGSHGWQLRSIALLRASDVAFRSEDKAALRSEWAELSKSIRKAKGQYTQHFCDPKDVLAHQAVKD